MAVNTLTNIQIELRRNLDDPDDTGFSDAALTLLINEAINWLIVEAETFDYVFRRKTSDISAVAGTTAYALPSDTRRVVKIERIEGTTVRQRGTIISIGQVDEFNYRWAEPICFIDHDGTNMNINYATLGAPKDAHTLRVHYVPTLTALSAGGDAVLDFEEQFLPLMIMRATMQGYGGEKDAAPFWVAPYQAALNTAMEQWENRHGQYVRVVDGNY